MHRSETPAPRAANKTLRFLVVAGVFAALASPAQAASAAAGKTRFENECASCHSGEPGDGMGGIAPDLHVVAGKAAGTVDKNYKGSAALRGSKLVWNAATLDRFLAAPTKVVPGTDMTIAVTNKAARDDMIAYLLSVKKAPARK